MELGKLEKLEKEVSTLSAEELAEFREWFHEFDAEAWDRKIESDAFSGKLDVLANKALNAHKAGKTTPL